MSFIAGVIDFEKSVEVDTAILNLRQSISRRAGQVHIVPSKWGIVCSGNAPEHLPKMNRWLCTDGFVDSSLKDLDSPDAESLLSNTPLDGEFALCLFDEETSSLILRRDLLGLIPIYYSFTDTKFVWGSDIKTVLALIGETPEVDEQGLAELLAPFGKQSSDLFRTPFKNVFSLEPGYALKLTNNSVKKTKVEEFRVSKSYRQRNLVETCEEFRFLLSKSILNKIKKRKTAVSLSGGADSFAIFSTARDLFEKGKLCTSPLAINYLSQGIDSPPRNYIDQIWTLEAPFISRQWRQTSDVFKIAKQNGCEILLSGQWGEQLVNSKPTFRDFFPKGQWRDFKQHLENFWNLPGSLHQKNIFRLLKSKNHYLCSEWLYKIGRKFDVGTTQPFLDRELVQFLFDVRSELIPFKESNFLKESMKPIAKMELPNSVVDVSQEFLSDSYVLEVWKRLFTLEFFDTLAAEDGDNVDLHFCKLPNRIEYNPKLNISEYIQA